MKYGSLALVLLATLIPVALSAPARNTAPKPIIALELKVTQPVIKVGEFPKLAVEVINKSMKEIVLVKPGDGSLNGWRTPLIEWRVGGVKPKEEPRCGNISALKADEIVTLKPGERASLGEWIGTPGLPGVGKYKIRFRYENKPDQKWQGLPLGEHDQATMALIRSSTPAAAESNEVEIEVKE